MPPPGCPARSSPSTAGGPENAPGKRISSKGFENHGRYRQPTLDLGGADLAQQGGSRAGRTLDETGKVEERSALRRRPVFRFGPRDERIAGWRQVDRAHVA